MEATPTEGDLRPSPRQRQAYRRAAVLLLLYPRAGEDYVVFMRRTETVEHHKGQISLPGGSQDDTDPDLVFTALREAREELGVDPSTVEVAATLKDVYVPVSGFVITPVVARLVSRTAELVFRPNPDEVAEIIEVPLSALRGDSIHHTEPRIVEGVTNTIHFYTYGPYQIWGATGRIIYDFLNGEL